MSVYTSVVKPVAFSFDPEFMHKAALKAGELAGRKETGRALVRSLYYHSDSGLAVTAGSITYPSPAGVAAGYDKYGQWVDITPDLSTGHHVLGTITPEQRDGNPIPRLFRLPLDYGLINRMGLNNAGAIETSYELEDMSYRIPLTISLDPKLFFVEDTEKDQIKLHRLLAARDELWIIPYAKELNISCPNTADGKAFESPEGLDALLDRTDEINRAARRDTYVKFSHDLEYEQFGELIDVCDGHYVTGFVVGNTSNSREGLRTSQKILDRIGKGGLSGAPLLERKLKMVQYARKKTNGEKVIIGVGGIGCDPRSNPANDALGYMLAGAHMVQVLTGIPYYGFSIFRDINRGLSDHLSGYTSFEDFLKRRG